MYGSKDATREAFKTGLLENGEAWMKMKEEQAILPFDIHRRVE